MGVAGDFSILVCSGSGRITSTVALIRGLGVKYCPARFVNCNILGHPQKQ